MAERPTYLQGRGRGRGRGSAPRPGPDSPPSPLEGGLGYPRPGSRTNKQPRNYSLAAKVQQPIDHHENNRGDEATQGRFQDAATKHQRAALQHLTSTGTEDESSSEEEDLDDDRILSSVLQSFSATSDEVGPSDLGRTEGYLTNSIKSKSNVCLICIETIRRTEAIWCCHGCFTMFHVACIQKWVKDGVYQQTLHSDEVPRKDLPWNCPKCRFEYTQSQCPTRYYCFCGKERDPAPDPWLVPHSCGQVCQKRLQPECGHSCLLLCHPGPCPPCPKTVRVSCHCKKCPATVRRCGSQAWSCGKPCQKPLTCGHHECQKPCHEGDCPPCPETSVQPCLCRKETSIRPCADPSWQCKNVCGGELSCGEHSCDQVCHSGNCGPCPRTGNRTCPCGKTDFQLPCTEDIPTCVDTCGKLLACGQHECNQRCHYGPCGSCREMTRKKCHCGKKEKQIQCYKEFTCDVKCTNVKDCGKHVCKRKCCDGNCPPCEQPCGKTLGCRNHKCSSRCHQNQCYPCPLTVSISCNCGATSVTVPCGGEKFTRPPRCNKPCQRPPDCHHAKRDKHRCHFGPCPPCRQICDRALEQCDHRCPVTCHSAVLMQVQEKVQRAGPWEAQPQPRLELRKFGCPPCKVPVLTTCLGKHETFPMGCAEVTVSSCHRPCGRSLPCGNHECQLECHAVPDVSDSLMAGASCMKCEEPCSKPRPDGCTHPCLLPCHPGLCPPCAQMIRMRCHCQQLVLHVECDQWTHADDTERNRLQSCQSTCPKMLPCKHKCKAICHPGDCPDPERCVEKVNVRCKCKRRKRNYLCNEVQAGYGTVECDEVCQQNKDKQKQESEQKQQESLAAAKRKEQEEIEAFQRKLGPRKHRPRKPKQEHEPPTFLQKYGKYIVAPLLIALLAVFVYCLLNTAT